MFQAFRRTPAGRAAPARPRPLPTLEPLEDRRVPAVIGGTVYLDLNNNGLLDPGEPGLPNSALELRNAAGQAIAHTISDANGQYRFSVDQTVDTSPATKTVEAVFGPADTDVTRTQAVAQFDPSLGTLTAVEIIAEATLTSQMKVENLGPNAATVNGSFAGTLSLQAPGTAPLTANPTGNVSANVGAFDGTIDLGGPSGHDFGPTRMDTIRSVVLNASTTDLSAYVGTGQVTLTQAGTATSTAAGPGNLLAMIRSTVSGDVKVVYHYNPSNALRPGTYTVVQTQEPPGGPVNVAGALGPLFSSLSASNVDLSTLRVVCDWIQYRHNFCEPVEIRPVLAERQRRAATGTDRPAENALEIGIDLRRVDGTELATSLKQALAEHALPDHAGPAGTGRVPLEPWGPASESCLWRFNTLYWQALSRWEEVTGREYEQALPGGKSHARDTETARDSIRELLRVWDELSARRALPEELYVVELGVGNGSQALTWLDTFAELDAAHGRDYYRRLHYLMGDYSAHVLERARRAIAHHSDRVSALVLDATRPQITLGFLRGKAFCVYISNVYDNLPTDEVAIIRGRPYLVEARACLRQEEAATIAGRFGGEPAGLPALIWRLLRLGPDLLSEAAPGQFPGPADAVALWQDLWAALRLQERYAPLEGLDAYRVSDSATGEILRPLLESSGDVRMHVSNGALASFAETLPLLHPFGRLQCHDLFVTRPDAYHTGFYGPGKYDGSVVNWVNGPLLALIGNRRGFDVQITPLSGHPTASVTTLTAQVRD